MNTPAEYFDTLFAANEDPWAFRQRWYEKRKRDLSLAALLHQRYERIFEPGCANGELSLALAERSDYFLGMDLCERAVDLARDRLRAAFWPATGCTPSTAVRCRARRYTACSAST